MSHELEIDKDGKASFVYARKNGDPWHRLGTPVEDYLTPAEALVACNGNYAVTKEPLFARVPLSADAHGNVATYDVLVPGKIATVRVSPISGEREVLGVLGEKYKVVNNLEVMEKAYAVVGAAGGDACVDTAGVLYEGRRFFAYLRLDDLIIDPEGIDDRIERGLALYSSHDGTIAVTYAFTDIRAVCANTVSYGISHALRVFKAKHTKSVDDRIQEADKVLGISTEWARTFTETANRLLGVRHSNDRFRKVLDRVFPEPNNATDRQKDNTRQVHSTIRHTFEADTNAGKFGKSGWTMFNAIVEYLDHKREADSDQRLLATMDPRPNNWLNQKKAAASEAILALS